MVAKLIILTHKISIQVQLFAESSTIGSFRSRRPVRKLLDTPSYVDKYYAVILIPLVNELQYWSWSSVPSHCFKPVYSNSYDTLNLCKSHCRVTNDIYDVNTIVVILTWSFREKYSVSFYRCSNYRNTEWIAGWCSDSNKTSGEFIVKVVTVKKYEASFLLL